MYRVYQQLFGDYFDRNSFRPWGWLG